MNIPLGSLYTYTTMKLNDLSSCCRIASAAVLNFLCTFALFSALSLEAQGRLQEFQKIINKQPYGEGTAGDTILNSYAVVLKIDQIGCQPAISVDSPEFFSIGDKVLIIQMQGVSIVDSNNSGYGAIVDINTAGNYEFARISHLEGNILFLQAPLLQAYSISGIVQIIRVAEYQSKRLGAVTGKSWDGKTGGVIAISVSDTLYLDGNISISDKGFRGGTAVDADTVPNFQVSDYRATFRPSHYGQKGEGVAFFGVDDFIAGRGAPANGGGGGNNHNAGGGGGANAGCGGVGGWAYNGNNHYSGNKQDAQGTGGYAITASTGRIFMGGGGGAGHGNNNQSSILGATSGGNGGGIIVLEADVIVGNGYSLQANGESSLSTEADGTGGGGGGGSIVLNVNHYVGSLTIESLGGGSGSVAVQGVGSGGSGGGGYIIASGIALPTHVTTRVQGGDIGKSAGEVWGNTRGCVGSLLYNTTILFNTISGSSIVVNVTPDTTLCYGDSLQMRTVIEGTVGQVSYRWSPVTGVSNPTIANPFVSPANSTIYTLTVTDMVGCVGSTQTTITITSCDSLSCAVINGIINDYSEVVEINYGNPSITLVGPHSFVAGDQILLIQMQGATISNANEESYGTITNIGAAGLYEFAIVQEVKSDEIVLTAPLSYSTYNTIQGRVQVVKVPEFDHVTIDSILTCSPWDGKTGGVLAINANCLIIGASIDVSGKGFRGADYRNESGSVGLEHSSEFISSSSFFWALKGEGIAGNGIPPFLYGKGSPANGGGGGNNHNAGGGGGANYGVGGIGGYGYQGVLGSIRLPQGYGGKTLSSYSLDDRRLFMGGGGGSGHINHDHGSRGANGGGIIVVRANTVRNPYQYTIRACGENAPHDTSYVNPDGCGGGGAGGTIILAIQNLKDSIIVDVGGGAGGSRIHSVTSSGPGGGGGGGITIINQDVSLLKLIQSNVLGGAAGIDPSGKFYGAMAGTNGLVRQGELFLATLAHKQITGCRGCLPVVQQKKTCGITTVKISDEGFAIDKVELVESKSHNIIMNTFVQLPANQVEVVLTLIDTTAEGYCEIIITNTLGHSISWTGVVQSSPPRPQIEWDGKTLLSSSGYHYQWLLNGYPVYNGSEQYFTPTLPGEYAVLVTDSAGCSTMSDTFVISFTTVEQETIVPLMTYTVNLYPNPAVNIMTIDINAPIVGDYKIEICDILGVPVYSQLLHIDTPGRFISTVSVESFAPGVYNVYMRSAHGFIIKRFVRQ